jgi:protein gp37
MALQSGIEWTEATRNFVTGCSKVSRGCKHCYAERTALRSAHPGHNVPDHSVSQISPVAFHGPQSK